MNNGGGSVVELTTGVNSAVEQLRELGKTPHVSIAD